MDQDAFEQLNDKSLVDLCREGNEAAFTVLYNRYRLQLFSYLHRILPDNRSLVDDLFQQVWIKAVRNWNRYTDQQLLLAWLCRIAHNLVMDHFRSNAGKNTVEVDDRILADTFNPEEVHHQIKLDEALQEAIEKLPPDQREIVRLRIAGVSFKDIAAQKNFSINTALGRMHYAVQNLRKLLAEFLV